MKRVMWLVLAIMFMSMSVLFAEPVEVTTPALKKTSWKILKSVDELDDSTAIILYNSSTYNNGMFIINVSMGKVLFAVDGFVSGEAEAIVRFDKEAAAPYEATTLESNKGFILTNDGSEIEVFLNKCKTAKTMLVQLKSEYSEAITLKFNIEGFQLAVKDCVGMLPVEKEVTK